MSSLFWTTNPSVLFRADQLLASWPTAEMSYNEKLNSIVRLSIYVTIVLLLFRASYLVLYIPLVTFFVTYGMYVITERKKTILQKSQLHEENTDIEKFSLLDDPTAGKYSNISGGSHYEHSPSQYEQVTTYAAPTTPSSQLPSSLSAIDGGVRKCTASTKDNPFMNMLVSEIKNNYAKPPACSRREQDNIQQTIEKNFDARTFRDLGDVWDHSGGRRQFFTMPWTTLPNDPAGDFPIWLYDQTPTKKEQSLLLKPFRSLNSLL